MYVEPKTIARLIETGSRIVVARAGDGRGGDACGSKDTNCNVQEESVLGRDVWHGDYS